MRFLLVLVFGFSLLFSAVSEDDFSDEFGAINTQKEYDPLKSYNVVMTDFNDYMYTNIMGPIAKNYAKVVAKPVRTSISNFFENLFFPIRLANNLLQLKFKNSFEESARFLINSTFGVAGLLDVAKSEGKLEAHNEDFGQTLGFYGVGSGPHIVLPLLGPSNLRDVVGIVGDTFISPLNYARNNEISNLDDDLNYYLLQGGKTINNYSLHVKEYEAIRKSSIDLYPLLKSAYEQRRNKLIKE
ncbi:VacJ family lipoprotein [Sulfurospirillum sp. 1307]|jgi:phospholipid-binding lipoprotein MlaA